jgi:cell division protein FtsB
VTPGRWVALVVLAAAGFFAWTGGTYSQADFRALRAQEEAMRARIDSLRIESDSLRLFRDSLLSSRAVQERMAREVLGMIRPGELMIKLVEDSTTPAEVR